MSDTQQPDGKKLSPNDAKLKLYKKPPLNKKLIRALVFSFVGLVGFGVMIGLSPHKPKAAKDKENKPSFANEAPSNLNINPEDYGQLPAEKPQPAEADYGNIPHISQNAPSVSQNQPQSPYRTYTENPQPTKQSAQFINQPTSPGPNSQNPNAPQNEQQSGQRPLPSLMSFNGIAPDDEQKRLLAALTSGFFFPWTASDDQGRPITQKPAQQSQSTDQSTDAQVKAVQAAYDSAYNKQNLQQEKQDFIARQQGDYSSAYLDNHYLNPVDAKHVLEAGTLIPITMVTGINSDLPGTIIAQVIENVFDTLTGQNILIPRGSKLTGTYDSSISFGQDRVLIVWNRLIRTDGVSISLRGMKGTDLQGKAGLHDQVDYHLAEILEAVGASTAFNVATNAAIAAMSTNQFLSSLSAAMIAQGSTSTNVTSAANQVATNYANKELDRQPTIVIREGTRAYCLIDKDMILPAFVDQDGGYMP